MVHISNDKKGDMFTNKEALIEFSLLKILKRLEEPVGSWVLKIMLELENVDISIATIGRALKKLDGKQLTELVENRGRILTRKGDLYLREISDRMERLELHQRLINAVQPRNLNDLIDLLHARKVIEKETAKLAAAHSTPNNIEALETALHKHEKLVFNNEDPTSGALDFHRKVAECSQNRFLIAVLDILIYEEVKLESHFAELTTRERGKEYFKEHQTITDCIKEGDPEGAERQMEDHMEKLIRAVQEQKKRK